MDVYSPGSIRDVCVQVISGSLLAFPFRVKHEPAMGADCAVVSVCLVDDESTPTDFVESCAMLGDACLHYFGEFQGTALCASLSEDPDYHVRLGGPHSPHTKVYRMASHLPGIVRAEQIQERALGIVAGEPSVVFAQLEDDWHSIMNGGR